MANFGFARLAVVAAYEPHWREARSAVGAPELLKSATESESLSNAIADCTLVVGTGTLTHRKPEQSAVSLPALAPIVQSELDRGGRIALIFGPEKHGLTREDLSYCNLFVEIPTDARQPSMNLGQAAAVCLYELASRTAPDENHGGGQTQHAETPMEEPSGESTRPKSASSVHLEILSELIAQAMIASDYSPRTMQAANRQSIRLLLRRLRLNSADSRRILGLFRRILWHFRRVSKRNVTN
jgi:tRNA/rRNA methyltransferase